MLICFTFRMFGQTSDINDVSDTMHSNQKEKKNIQALLEINEETQHDSHDDEDIEDTNYSQIQISDVLDYESCDICSSQPCNSSWQEYVPYNLPEHHRYNIIHFKFNCYSSKIYFFNFLQFLIKTDL